MDTALGHEVCLGQCNVSEHDLSHIPAEARNVPAWFDLASGPPALHRGVSMPQAAAAPGAWTVLLEASLALLGHPGALL